MIVADLGIGVQGFDFTSLPIVIYMYTVSGQL